MRVAFLGTPDVAVPSLRALIAEPRHDVACVVTQPDRPRGRGRQLSPSPVKEVALEAGIDVLQPENPKEDSFVQELSTFAPQALVVVAYGHILSKDVLQVAPAINAHFSLLPAYRGAAPVQRALMDGATHTGVSVFLLEPTVDSGPVLRSVSTPIRDDENAGELLERLAPMAADVLLDALSALEAGEKGQQQDPALASPAPKIKPEDQILDLSQPASILANRIRGLSPSPGAYTMLEGRRLVIGRARADDDDLDGPPGTLHVDDGTMRVATGGGSLVLREVKPEGKRMMDAADFLRGSRLASGTKLG